ncbi:GNAT family N-acetyltransferase [Candidatus Dojkabacteria bacterium]|nr:GNAT family N-acetyltransferase [Candidatus Dojkabacteria bacterium]
MNRLRYRKIIHSYILIFGSFFLDEVVRHPNYDLVYTLDDNYGYFNCAMNLNLGKDSVDDEIQKIEKYFKIRQKSPSISVEQSSRPDNLEALLLKRGYINDPSENVVLWTKSLPGKDVVYNDKVKFSIAYDFGAFQDYLYVANEAWSDIFDYTHYASSLSKLFTKVYDGVTSMHIVGYVDDNIVCSSTLALYLDMAHLVNISVLPDFRRQGIGSEMIKYASGEALKKKASEIYICIDEKDEPGSGLLNKLGFDPEIKQTIFTKKP